jgi:hypothetical protein
MPKEMYVAPARWKNFKMKPVKVYDITGDYDNVRHMCFRKNLQMYTAFLNNSHTVKPFDISEFISFMDFSMVCVKFRTLLTAFQGQDRSHFSGLLLSKQMLLNNNSLRCD